jgi:adenine/guanine/hypoxanthine permease
MGLNAYFAYSVVGTHGNISYQTAFAAVFVAGIIFILLSLTSFRQKLIEAIPENLKYGISAGIGLFIAFIGLKMSGIISKNAANLVGLGDLHAPATLLTIAGLTVTLILMSLKVNGAMFYGMIFTGILAILTGQLKFQQGFVSSPSLPEGLIITNPFDAFSQVIGHSLYAVVFSFLLVTIFDTTGTMVGVAQQARLMKGNSMPRAGKALLSDSIATTVGAIFGTSPTTAFIESTRGVAAGGRTGLTSVVIALLFIISAFFGPLVSSVSGLAAITAPSLIIVGSLMMGNISRVKWDSLDEAFPAFLVIISMPLTSSIATGIALGFISYPILKIVRGKWREVHPLVYIFAILFFYQLAFLQH